MGQYFNIYILFDKIPLEIICIFEICIPIPGYKTCPEGKSLISNCYISLSGS